MQLVMGLLQKWMQNVKKVVWETLLDDVVSSINTRVLLIHGQSQAELCFGFTPRHHVNQSLDNLVTYRGLDDAACGLRLATMDKAPDMAGRAFTIAAYLKEQNTSPDWMPLKEGDLVLVRNVVVTKHLGHKLDGQWVGASRLVDVSCHQRSGRLQHLITGEIVKREMEATASGPMYTI